MGRERNPPKDGISDDDSGSGSSSHDHGLEEGDAQSAPGELSDVDDTPANNNQPLETEDDDGNSNKEGTKKKKKVRRLKLATTQNFNATLQKRGVVYLSRIPPRMGPARVKTLLADFGSISRIYLVEEDKTVRKKRRKAGGSSGKRYTEGWVEFESKKAAKLVGETLNMTKVTNHKGSIHYDDLWNVKYLRGFKWSHLTEKVAYERRVREQKLRVEMMEVRRENAAYVAQVEAGKRLDYIEERRRKRGDKEGGVTKEDTVGIAKKKRKIRQKKPFEGDNSSTKSAILGSLV
mmetsp:Transcript_3740/g.8486  ORF Transcript_3740/g.8486 Transcript_3740/m.8486 type:complete len:291 (+) Transcript_3740:93-965(+)